MSHLAVKTVRPSMQSVEHAVRKQARKNSLFLPMAIQLYVFFSGCNNICISFSSN
jgi:hypothetical protein